MKLMPNEPWCVFHLNGNACEGGSARPDTGCIW